jgi:hypothetical protein
MRFSQYAMWLRPFGVEWKGTLGDEMTEIPDRVEWGYQLVITSHASSESSTVGKPAWQRDAGGALLAGEIDCVWGGECV